MSATAPPPGTRPGGAAIDIYVSDGHHYHHGAHVTDLSAGVGSAVAASRQVQAGDICKLLGLTVYETTGAAAASLTLHDGSSNAGALVAVVAVAAGGYASPVLPAGGVRVQTGKLYISIIAGSVAGCVYWI